MNERATDTIRVPSQQPVATTPTILLVDDDILVAKALGRVLEANGYAVHISTNGGAAMKALSSAPFDVVISDIQLPTISGVQLLELVRTYDLDVPVILVTGAPRVETAIAAVQLGALQYLTKPVDTDALLAVVKRATNLHGLARAKRDALALQGTGTEPGDRAGMNAAFDRMLESMWPAFQPIVAHDGSITAFEALLRSKEPSLPHPGAVFAAAEALGRTADVGDRMREVTCAAFHAATRPTRLFVNVHPQDLMDPRLLDPTAPLSQIAERVVLEITERASLDEIKDVQNRVTQLRDLGFRIAVDDLGAGYAGLTSFALLEPDIVKLDMSLIRDADTSDVKQRIIGSMVTLSKEMGMRVVAEGIETQAERRAVSLLGCDWLQGYLFARPGPAFPEVTHG